MRSFVLVALIGLGVGVTAGSLLGDIPGPGPRPSRPVPQMVAMPPVNATNIIIEVSKEATRPRLVIPKPLLEKCAAYTEKQELPEGFPLPALDHLVFALILVGGGLYLLRGRVRLAFAAAMLLAVGVTLGLGRSNSASANAPPPIPSGGMPVRVGEALLNDVEIVVSPDWGELKLTLPPSEVKRLRQ